MKQIKLTKKQELVLNYIKEYTAKHGFPPAVREIAKGVGLNSPSSVHSHIKRLERDGFIKKTNSKFRTLEVVGINEFKTDDTKAIKLKLYRSIQFKDKKETFDLPVSRTPKNVEIFAYKINEDLEEIKKEDIIILIKAKTFEKNDTLLLYKDSSYSKYIIKDKKELIPSDYIVVGKIIEVVKMY